MNKHTAILPDGTTAKRNSENRIYTHCVAVRRDGGPWKAATWCGRRDLAEKQLQHWGGIRQYKTNIPVYVEARILTVTVTQSVPRK